MAEGAGLEEVRPHDDIGVHRKYFARTRLAVADGELLVDSDGLKFGLPGTLSPAPIAAGIVLTAFKASSRAGKVAINRLLVVDGDGRALWTEFAYAKNGGHREDDLDTVWNRSELQRFSQAAGLAYSEEEYPDPQALESAHPGAVPNVRMFRSTDRIFRIYPYIAGILLVAIILVLIFK